MITSVGSTLTLQIMMDDNPENQEFQDNIAKITENIWEIAQSCQGNTEDLLHLLRHLEKSHRRIRTELFEVSLPNNRQALYHLLREIDDQGGWPYIEKMRIKELFKYFSQENPEDPPR